MVVLVLIVIYTYYTRRYNINQWDVLCHNSQLVTLDVSYVLKYSFCRQNEQRIGLQSCQYIRYISMQIYINIDTAGIEFVLKQTFSVTVTEFANGKLFFFIMIQVFWNNDNLSTRFINFQPEEQGAGVTLLVCFYSFYQNKICILKQCLLCQIRYFRSQVRLVTWFSFSFLEIPPKFIICSL